MKEEGEEKRNSGDTEKEDKEAWEEREGSGREEGKPVEGSK